MSPYVDSSRRSHAGPNRTPSIPISTSIRLGSTPIWKTMSSFWKSPGDTAPSGAPNCPSAVYTRAAFPALGSTHMSRPLVNRGRA